jgi:nitrite reductase/ring-hydroxylating ferredoxin subunit
MEVRLISFFCLLVIAHQVESFQLVMMGRRAAGKGKGNLKKSLSGESVSKKKGNSVNSLNQGRGQEITGVTLPVDGAIKGWEFGEGQQMACANVDGTFYAIQGDCPRCAFDLWKGDLIANDPAWEELPRVACPTCSTTYSFVSGKYGPPIKRTGLAAFVGKLASTATATEKLKNAEAFQITQDEEGRVYCLKKQQTS